MKDILRIMRLDWTTGASSVSLKISLYLLLFSALISLFFMPLGAAYIIFAAPILLAAVTGSDDRSGIQKLWGILPVRRRSITRGRFAFIFCLHFAAELTAILLTLAARSLKLYRLLGAVNPSITPGIEPMFTDKGFVNYGVSVGIFVVCCLLAVYIEMIGQIHGRENEMRNLLIALGTVTGVAFVFFQLSNYDIVSPFETIAPRTFAQCAVFSAILNLVMLALCVLFCEITAARLAKREL